MSIESVPTPSRWLIECDNAARHEADGEPYHLWRYHQEAKTMASAIDQANRAGWHIVRVFKVPETGYSLAVLCPTCDQSRLDKLIHEIGDLSAKVIRLCDNALDSGHGEPLPR